MTTSTFPRRPCRHRARARSSTCPSSRRSGRRGSCIGSSQRSARYRSARGDCPPSQHGPSDRRLLDRSRWGSTSTAPSLTADMFGRTSPCAMALREPSATSRETHGCTGTHLRRTHYRDRGRRPCCARAHARNCSGRSGNRAAHRSRRRVRRHRTASSPTSGSPFRSCPPALRPASPCRRRMRSVASGRCPVRRPNRLAIASDRYRPRPMACKLPLRREPAAAAG